MNEFKGTPGPWAVENDIHGKLHVTGGGFDLAEVGVSPGSDIRADARLMAAAPELLKGLMDLLKAYESVMHSEFDYPGDPWTAEGRDDDDAIAAKAAIAKALGEKP